MAPSGVPAVGEPPDRLLGPPGPTPVLDPAALLDPFWTSPAVALLGPLPLPGVGSRSPAWGAAAPRPGQQASNGDGNSRGRSRAWGGQGHPFAALPSEGMLPTAPEPPITPTWTRAVIGAGTSTSDSPELPSPRLGVLARFDELNLFWRRRSRRATVTGRATRPVTVGALDQPDGGGGPDMSTRAEASAPPTQAPRSEDQSDITASLFI